MTRACGVAAAVLVLARTRVAIWPGWSVPLAAVILATALALLAAAVAALAAVIVSRTWPRTVRAGVRTPVRTRTRTQARTGPHRAGAVRADIPVRALRLSDRTDGGDAE